MKKKTDLLRRDHYGTLLAAVRCAELIHAHLGDEPGPVELRLEDPRFPGWDDIVEVRRTAEGDQALHVWQVKRQRTDWQEKSFGKLLRQLDAAANVKQGHLALYQLTRIKPVGELRVLEDLCQRVQQEGVDLAHSERELSRPERQWCKFIQRETHKDDIQGALQLLRKLVIFQSETETKLRSLGETRLWSWYRDPAAVLQMLVAYLDAHSDSVVTVDLQLLEREVLKRFERRGGASPNVRERYLELVLRTSDWPVPLRITGGREIRMEDVLVLPDISEAFDVGEPVEEKEDQPPLPPKPRPRPVLDLLKMLSHPGERAALFLVEGPIGSGKSMLLQHARLELARAAKASAEAPVPILLNAPDLVDGQLDRAVQQRMPGLAEQGVLGLVGARYVFLVDGLDEVERRSEVKIGGCLKDLAERPGTAALVIASRPDAPPFLIPEPQRLRINPWRPEQVERFLERWGAQTPDGVAQVRALRNWAAVMPLLSNPLTATFCLLLAREEPGALRSRASLFRGIAAKLFQDWVKRRSTPGPAPSWWEVAPSFQELALEMLRDGEDAVDHAGLSRRLAALARDRELEYLEVAQRRFGLLVQQPDGRYRFLVKGIAEHLAGEALLRRGKKEILAASGQRWAEEPIRHAVGLAAAPGQPGRALAMIRELLPRSTEAIQTLPVRRAIVALRIAVDLGQEAADLADLVAEPIAAIIANDSSRWASLRVSKEFRDLERAGGPCWDAIRERLEVRLSRKDHPAAWFAGVRGQPWTYWASVLWHQDPNVRSIAIDRLTEHVDVPRVQELLFSQLFDTSATLPVPGTLLPTRAALGLRKASRPFGHERILEELRCEVRRGAPISGAAAAALLPTEAPLREMVVSLRELCRSYLRPPGVVEVIAKLDEGRAALDELWPDWAKSECDVIESIPLGPEPDLPTPPPSPAARWQITAALGGAIARLTSLERERLGLDPTWEANILGMEAREHPELAVAILETSQSIHLATETQRAIGRAALIYPNLKEAVLTHVARNEPRFHRVVLGPMLEALVTAGDAEAVRRYGQWLLRFGSEVVPLRLPDIPAEVLLHPAIHESAKAVALRAWNGHFKEAGPDRIAPGAMAVTLRTLHPAWEQVEPIQQGLISLAQRDDVESLLLLLTVYPDPPFPERVTASVTRYLRGLEEVDRRAAIFQLPGVIQWASRAGLGIALETTLRGFSDHRSSLRYPATAALVASLGPERSEMFSARIAPEWPLWWLDAISGEHDLALLVSAAPRAWRDRLVQMAKESTFGPFGFMSGGIGFTAARLLMPHLRSSEERRGLLDTLEQVFGILDRVWIGDNPTKPPVRPSDQLEELRFDSA